MHPKLLAIVLNQNRLSSAPIEYITLKKTCSNGSHLPFCLVIGCFPKISFIKENRSNAHTKKETR
jgi:hypothetical protein